MGAPNTQGVTAGGEEQSAEPLDPEGEARAHRLQGLGVVLLVALARPARRALQYAQPFTFAHYDPTLGHLSRIVGSASLVCLTAYVLKRQGRTLGQLGVTARARDIALGLALAGLGLLPHAMSDLVQHGALGSWLVSTPSAKDVSLIGLIGLFCVAAEAGLILGAYLMTEVRGLTGSASLAVAGSIGTQVLYATDYRLPTVLSLLVYCLVYSKTRRATPLLLGHAVSGLWIWIHPAGS